MAAQNPTLRARQGLTARRRCLGLASVGVALAAVAVASYGPSTPPPEPDITSVVALTWRHSALWPGTGVLRLRNISGEPTPPIRLDYRSDENGAASTFLVPPIDPAETTEVGALDSGWAIKPNELVAVSAVGYATQELQFLRHDTGRMVMRTNGHGASLNFGERAHDALK